MTLIEYRELEQRSDEWYEARCGIVTASVVGRLLTAKTSRPASNDDSRALTALLAAERVTGYVEPTFMNADMFRGVEAEPYARDEYAARNSVEVRECGFMTEDGWGFSIGYSPDGLVGDDGLIEIKAPRQKRHLLTIVADRVPPEHMAQIQCGLLVSGRQWCDFISWCGGMPTFTKRVFADEDWAEAIYQAVAAFEKDAAAMVADYRALTKGLPVAERLDLEVVI